MKFAQRDGAEFEIYDKSGKLAVKLDFVNDSIIEQSKNKIIIKTQILSTDFYSFLYDADDTFTSDFDKASKSDSFEYLVGNGQKECKLILRSTVADEVSGNYKKLTYIVPNATVHTKFDRMNTYIGDAAEYEIAFHINPFDDKGHLFKIKIEK